MTQVDQRIPVLLYDSECTFCRRFKEALEKLPGLPEIKMVSIYDKEIYQEFSQLDPKECSDTVHLIDQDHHIHKGHEVPKYLVTLYPGVKRFAWLLEKKSVDNAVKFFYETINDYRKQVLKNCRGCSK